MLMTGIFPNLLKISKVIPLYKKDDNTNMSNYRPIALLLSFSKIFENVILLQLTKYLDENNLICEKQYGFRKNHSTDYAALHIVDFLNYRLDANKIPVSVYLDLSKTFDSLSHKIFLDKIKQLGITGLAYKLLQTYLLNRQQYVAFKNYKIIKCTYSATDKLLFAMLGLGFFCDISLAKESYSNHLRWQY